MEGAVWFGSESVWPDFPGLAISLPIALGMLLPDAQARLSS
jgi:hypothetical protein